MKGEKLIRNLLFVIIVMIIINFFFGGEDNSYVQELKDRNEIILNRMDSTDTIMMALFDSIEIKTEYKETINNYYNELSNEVKKLDEHSVVDTINVQLKRLGTAEFN